MKKRRIVGAAVAFLFIALMVIGVSPAQAPETETIVLIEKVVRGKVISKTDNLRPGDFFILRDELFEPGGAGDIVGRGKRVCTVHFYKKMLCIQSIALRVGSRGRIEAQGVIHLNGANDRLAVTGGTKGFQDVRGEEHRTAAGRNVRITLHLTH
jgi:hypothetical protein